MSKLDDIINPYLAKFPDHSIRALTALIYKKHPDYFSTEEHCRSAVRYRRGKSGKANLAKAKRTKKLIEGTGERSVPMPKSLAKPRPAYNLPSGRTLVLSDVHIPYHDLEALEAALNYSDTLDIDNILLNGDTIDFYAISRWDKDPEVRNLTAELEKTRAFLMHLRGRYPNAHIIWKNGNHEERWEKYLWHKAPELCGVSDFELSKILRFDEYKVDFVHGRQKIKAGKHLTIIHGHEIPGAFDPVNFARTLCVKLKVCAMAGHKHKVSQHTEKTADDKYITCWSTGCFEEMHPDYMPMNNWGHGFAVVDLKKDDFKVTNHSIINGRVI
jgi:metallophosphoesterase superfamily enzyme